MTEYLNDPCDNFTYGPWTKTASPTIVAGGHTGNGFSLPGSSAQSLSYDIPSGNQTDEITLKFWWKTNSNAVDTYWSLRSDSGTSSHVEVKYTTGGWMRVYCGSTEIGRTTSIPTVNVWYYFELGCRMAGVDHGSLILKRDGTELINVAGVQTKNGGTKSVFDQVRFHGIGSAGFIQIIDDISINDRFMETDLRLARQSLRVALADEADISGINVWTGSAWEEKPVKVWNGTAWVAKPLKHWNGTDWV